MKAVLLAGGESRYLRPITDTRPTAMAMVLNKPIVERILRGLPEIIDEVFVTYNGNPVLKRFFKKVHKNFPKITLVEEKIPLGSAGSLKVLEETLTDTFVVLQTDIISSLDLDKTIEFHRERGDGIITMSVFRSPNPVDYGIVGLDDENQVVKFLEKPKGDQVFSTLVNAGTYVCEPRLIQEIPHHGYCDFANDIFPRLLRKGDKIYGREFRGFWADIGDFEKYLLANRKMLERSMTLKMKSRIGARVMPPIFVGENCVIHKEATLGPYVSIGDGAKVGKGCKIHDSVIYPDVRIGADVLINNSVVCEGVEVKRGAVVVGAILGDKVVVERNVKVGYDARVWPKKKVKRDVEERELFGAPRDFKI